MAFNLSRSTRLAVIIVISFCFFVGEISVGFYTGSLALVADAFHYLNDLIGFIVAFTALRISQLSKSPKQLSFGWQRAQLLGAFFNGVFLLALGVSIFLQSIERFISIQEVKNPKLVLIVGCIGFGLNVVSAAFIHEHDHPPANQENETELQPQETSSSINNNLHLNHRHNRRGNRRIGRDLGMMGVFLHVVGDAANNLGVIIAAAVIWRTDYPGRFYADPGVSMGIAILILISSVPLVKKAGSILLGSSPVDVDVADIQHDLEKTPGILSVHELHVWRLTQEKSIASMHVVVSEESLERFTHLAHGVNECLHAYDIHSSTIQPEVVLGPENGEANRIRNSTEVQIETETNEASKASEANCQIACGPSCDDFYCCN